MDIKTSFLDLLEQAKEKDILADQKLQAAADAQKAVLASQKDLEEKKVELDSKIKLLSGLDATKERLVEIGKMEEEVRTRKSEAVLKENELIRYETKLASIATSQQSKEEELKTREAKLNEDKKTYKEELKKTFFEELNSKISS